MAKKKRKPKRSYFYRFSAWLHLWLGLISGVVVLIVSLTAAILVFENELKSVFEPYQQVEQTDESTFLPPSELSDAVKDKYDFPSVWSVVYRGEGQSALVPYYADPSQYQEVYVNPYTGEVLHNRHLNNDFWRFILSGHYNLWLPRSYGEPIVAYATLIFVLALLSGLVLWWPKKWSKANKNKSFKIKWKAKFRRLNLDLHNVLGFYALLIALVFGLTGMVYGMNWFSDFTYWSASGGGVKTEQHLTSDTTSTAKNSQKDQDVLFDNLMDKGVDFDANKISFKYPGNTSGVWTLSINPSFQSRWQAEKIYYEQNSMNVLKKESFEKDKNAGDKLMRLNYDLHVGSIGGIWTKIIAFLVCLISASLPVTGFLVWWKKKKKQRWKSLKFPRP